MMRRLACLSILLIAVTPARGGDRSTPVDRRTEGKARWDGYSISEAYERSDQVVYVTDGYPDKTGDIGSCIIEYKAPDDPGALFFMPEDIEAIRKGRRLLFCKREKDHYRVMRASPSAEKELLLSFLNKKRGGTFEGRVRNHYIPGWSTIAARRSTGSADTDEYELLMEYLFDVIQTKKMVTEKDLRPSEEFDWSGGYKSGDYCEFSFPEGASGQGGLKVVVKRKDGKVRVTATGLNYRGWVDDVQRYEPYTAGYFVFGRDGKLIESYRDPKDFHPWLWEAARTIK